MAGNKGTYKFDILSNDGTTRLIFNYFGNTGDIELLTVSSTGLNYKEQALYTYSGEKTFIGFSTFANATEPTYAVGDEFTFYAETEETLTLYIVEEGDEGEHTPTTVDISTLGLSEGTHFITVKAKASGYTNSDESNAVSYTVVGEET